MTRRSLKAALPLLGIVLSARGAAIAGAGETPAQLGQRIGVETTAAYQASRFSEISRDY